MHMHNQGVTTVDISAIRQLLNENGALYDAENVQTKFMHVDTPIMWRGIWYDAGRTLVHLCDCYMQVLDVTGDNTNKTVKALLTNQHDAKLEIVFNLNAHGVEHLRAVLLGFASTPETPAHIRRLLIALRLIVQSDTTKATTI